MLDIDGWAPPDGVDPNSGAAIESFIALLPAEFRQASYWYQFSSSAGLMQPDGSPYKRGMRVHLFFWLAVPIQDHLIKAYLQIHCYEQHLCTLSTRDGQPLLTPWIDMALFNPVQPHYIALPQFYPAVTCTISQGQRQGLVAKAVDHVAIPPINEDIVQKAQRLLNDRKHALNFYLGKQRRSNLVRTDSGLYQRTNYWSDQLAAPQTDRGFLRAAAYDGGQVRADTAAIILYFDWEGSPGSWFVKKAQPTIARRFGDYQTLPLRELSEGAYAYVRDNLRWFNEIDSYDRPLDAQGFLPGLATFANHRVNLVLAPTGSGKTKAIVDYIVTRKTQLFFYAAPTRALVAQMQRDLEQAGVAVRHYKDVSFRDTLLPGVIVTTNKSLVKFSNMASRQSLSFELIIDEIHTGLDEFNGKRSRAEQFELAIKRARKVYFLTGTLTALQESMLTHCVDSALNGAQPHFAVYRFGAVKSNPLSCHDAADFAADFIGQCEKLREMKAAGRRLPRMVFIVDSSRMELYRQALKGKGLQGDSLVISRQESTDEQVTEAARNQDKPILVCSPVFSVGLNFDNPPEVLWVVYKYTEVDTNTLVQALNRANRSPGGGAAEVRLYTNSPDASPMVLPARLSELAVVQGLLQGETTVPGDLEPHFVLDRLTYCQLRKVERNTRKAVHSLVDTDSFQNFKLGQPTRDLHADDYEYKNRKKVFQLLTVAAREYYDEDIASRMPKADGSQRYPWSYTSYLLEESFRSGHLGISVNAVARDEEHERCALVMVLCGLGAAKQGREVSPRRLLRLLGIWLPILTSQYDVESRFPDWRTAMAQKIRKIVPLFARLKELRDGQKDGNQFARRWMFTAPGRDAIEALAHSEDDFLTLGRKYDRLKQLKAEARSSASDKRRDKINKSLFNFAREFLATIGVTFEKVGKGQTAAFDPRLPIVPDWDFEAMELTLERLACSVEAWTEPADPLKPSILFSAQTDVAYDTCRRCVHMGHDSFCRLGYRTEDPLQRGETLESNCDAYSEMKKPLAQRFDRFHQDRLAQGYPDRVGAIVPTPVWRARIWLKKEQANAAAAEGQDQTQDSELAG